MTKKLYSKAKFAELAGVNPSNVTRACKSAIKAAVVGKQIDAAHPDAVAYLEKSREPHTPTNLGTGVDPLFNEAVEECRHANRWSANFLKERLSIGSTRAKRLFETMVASGVVPTDKPPPAPRLSRGNGVVKERKKRENSRLPQVAPASALKNSVFSSRPRYQPPESERDEDDLVEIPDNIYAFLDWTVRDVVDKFGTDARFVDFLSATQKIEAINEKRLKNAQTKGELVSRVLVKNQVIDTFNSAHLRLLKDGAKSIAAGVVSKHSAGMEITEIEAYVSDILGSFIKPIKNKIDKALKDDPVA